MTDLDGVYYLVKFLNILSIYLYRNIIVGSLATQDILVEIKGNPTRRHNSALIVFRIN
jgi:hypothetical protein